MYGFTPKIYTKVEHYEKCNYPVDSIQTAESTFFLHPVTLKMGHGHTHTHTQKKRIIKVTIMQSLKTFIL